MHREPSHADEAFQPPRTAGLYLLTGLLLVLVGLDLWPYVSGFLSAFGVDLPRSVPAPFGVRYALIAAVLGGARTLYGSLERLLDGRLGADFAIAIACIAAILLGEPLVAAEVVLVGLIGECLESWTFARTQQAVRKLGELFPVRCWRLRDGQEVRVLVADVRVGDIVVVKPGAKVPVDGVVRQGRSAVDVAALTGESLPQDRGPGDEVLAGSLNQFGALAIEATRVGEQTVAGQVIELTAKALKDKAPIERYADRLAAWFLPVVLGLAAVTFAANLVWYAGPFRGAGLRLDFWQAVRVSAYPTLAVLVVACPCALVLATPAAVLAAIGRLAGTGVLIKGGSALERLAGVRAFAFDKTGTLTEGRLELGDVRPIDGTTTADELIRLAATAEQRSEHPLARLIVHEAARSELKPGELDEFTAHPGAGVSASSNGTRLLVGTQRLLAEQGVPIPESIQSVLDEFDTSGQSALLVARDGVVLGVIGARDRVRPEAAAVLQELRQSGIQDIALLTGDRAAAAEQVAAELGIATVRAELLPVDKAEAISATPTAFVGDGINDAPALARATVGLAVGGATDIAAEAGDVVLIGDPLRPLPLLLRLSRETVRIIRQNIIAFAFVTNIVGIVLTGWLWPLFARSPGWYETAPIAGVIYHQIGSLAVLLNSMRLLAFERRVSRSRAATRLWPVIERADRAVEYVADIDARLHDLSHHWKSVAAGLAILGLIGYALSGLAQVGPDEVAVVRRFGRPVEDIGPGLHWRWPWPVETLTRVQPDRARTVEVGFRTVEDRSARPGRRGALTWQSLHEGEGVTRVESEAVLPTGDGNLIELLATVQYRVSDPRRYLLAVRDPDEILRAEFEAVLRETVAGDAFLDLLTVGRAELQRSVAARLRGRLEAYGGLGVSLDGVTLRDLHPPGPVVEAFHNVAKAAEDHDRKVKDAEAAALRARRQAEIEATETERKAAVAAIKTVRTAEQERDAFLAWYAARTTLPPADEARVLAETLGLIAGGVDPRAALLDHQRRRRELMAANAELIEFRLAWQALTEALGRRDKVFIDADKLPGRRNLMLFGPDEVTPVPVLVPGRTSGPLPPRSGEPHEP